MVLAACGMAVEGAAVPTAPLARRRGAVRARVRVVCGGLSYEPVLMDVAPRRVSESWRPRIWRRRCKGVEEVKSTPRRYRYM